MLTIIGLCDSINVTKKYLGGGILKIFRTKYNRLNYWLDVVLIMALLALLAYMFFWPIRVGGSSMSPGANQGDHLVISRFLGNFGRLSSGDIVLVSIGDSIAVKRLAAAPGDHMLLRGNVLYINGQAAQWVLGGANAISIDRTLGNEEFFLLGDNLTASIDSRHFGTVDRDQILAKILLRYFPLTAFRFY
ncbi:MAG: signal peptidase I [Defluviitaleaceae bacterium]|nr:signal peptidase I [Defluviitaleaceae bacterium]